VTRSSTPFECGPVMLEIAPDAVVHRTFVDHGVTVHGLRWLPCLGWLDAYETNPVVDATPVTCILCVAAGRVERIPR